MRSIRDQCALQASPDFKGIKTLEDLITSRSGELQASPDFKGIKTLPDGNFSLWRLQASPDFEGIKTCHEAGARRCHGFKPALISKGLRRGGSWCFLLGALLQASPDFKGIKTSITEHLRDAGKLQASPDFKGIKTR